MFLIDYNDSFSSFHFSESLHTSGFAFLKNHPVNLELVNKMYDKWSYFFYSEIDEKNKYIFDETNHDGFVSQDRSETAKGFSKKDEKEFYDVYNWGRCPEYLRDETIEFFKEMHNLATILVKWLDISNKDNFIDVNNSLLRPIYYPPTKSFVRAQEHGDINILTLLRATKEGGLQIRINNTWIDAPVDPSVMIINSGDMLNLLTNGSYPSGIHRVLGSSGKRISLPFFSHPYDELKLSEIHTALSFKNERFEDIGFKKNKDEM